jgi:hypothetical protein
MNKRAVNKNRSIFNANATQQIAERQAGYYI